MSIFPFFYTTELIVPKKSLGAVYGENYLAEWISNYSSYLNQSLHKNLIDEPTFNGKVVFNRVVMGFDIHALEKIAVACRHHKLPLTVMVDSYVCKNIARQMHEIIDEQYIAKIEFINTSNRIAEININELVVFALENNVRIAFKGYYNAWKEANIFASKVLNSKIFEIIQTAPESIDRRICSKINLPCSNYIALVVNEDGAIYPCKNLVDINTARLGYIHTFWNNPFTVNINIDELYYRGPKISERKEVCYKSNLSLICRNHREHFLQQEP